MDIEQKHLINAYFGFYGQLLTPKQQSYLQYYFEDDFSVVEIAEVEHVSRQAVSDNIKRSIDALVHYESVLHLQQNFEARQALASDLQAYVQQHYQSDEKLQAKIHALIQRDLRDDEEGK
jgi:predicted DNA-binding protein YlxM (UPF0122 family)